MDAVVFPSPVLNDDPGLGQRQEPLLAQALVAEAVVETFHMADLPRAPWFDIEGFDVVFLQVITGRRGDELRPVVRSDMLRATALLNGLFQCRDDVGRL